MVNSAITTRLIEEQDKDQWVELFLAYGVFYETSFTTDIVEGVWRWLMTPDHPIRGFVAHDGSTLLGFAHLRRHPDTFEAADSWFLDDLFTAPEYRGAGVARALFDAMSSYAAQHGGGTLRWITAEDNDRAQRLYDRIATRTSWVMYEKDIPHR